jgi:hypothetical protein
LRLTTPRWSPTARSKSPPGSPTSASLLRSCSRARQPPSGLGCGRTRRGQSHHRCADPPTSRPRAKTVPPKLPTRYGRPLAPAHRRQGTLGTPATRHARRHRARPYGVPS